MKRIFALFVGVLFVGVALWTGLLRAQNPAQLQVPKTRIEAFEAQTGTVIIRGFSKAGRLSGGLGGGVLTVEGIEFTDATTSKKEYGIVIDLKEGDRLERSNRVFIDFEEIDSLLNGVDYVAKMDKSVTGFESFQADFRTKGGLQVSTFSTPKEIMAQISCGSIGGTSLFLPLADLPKFRALVGSAKATVDSVRKH